MMRRMTLSKRRITHTKMTRRITLSKRRSSEKVLMRRSTRRKQYCTVSMDWYRASDSFILLLSLL